MICGKKIGEKVEINECAPFFYQISPLSDTSGETPGLGRGYSKASAIAMSSGSVILMLRRSPSHSITV